MKNHYTTLELKLGAKQEEIKKSYRRLAIKYHPDKNPDNKEYEEKIKEVNEAYETLSNDEKKMLYDLELQKHLNPPRQQGTTWRGRPPIQSTKSLRIKIKVTIEEALSGVTKKIKVDKKVKCKNCFATGFINNEKCKNCNGEGLVDGNETMSIRIPPGVSTGIQLVVQYKGDENRTNGVPGDLIIIIEEIEHDLFKREGDNIIIDYKISFLDAITKDTISVPLPKENTAHIKKINFGKTVRLQGYGYPVLDNKGLSLGDCFVTVNVFIPQIEKLNNDEIIIVKKMEEMSGFKPN